jgi:hypothetical protein
MTRRNLQKASLEELVHEYEQAAAAHGKALAAGSHRAANRAHDRLAAVYRELRRRAEAPRLLPLLGSQDENVRLWVAAHALEFAPESEGYTLLLPPATGSHTGSAPRRAPPHACPVDVPAALKAPLRHAHSLCESPAPPPRSQEVAVHWKQAAAGMILALTTTACPLTWGKDGFIDRAARMDTEEKNRQALEEERTRKQRQECTDISGSPDACVRKKLCPPGEEGCG